MVRANRVDRIIAKIKEKSSQTDPKEKNEASTHKPIFQKDS